MSGDVCVAMPWLEGSEFSSNRENVKRLVLRPWPPYGTVQVIFFFFSHSAREAQRLI